MSLADVPRSDGGVRADKSCGDVAFVEDVWGGEIARGDNAGRSWASYISTMLAASCTSCNILVPSGLVAVTQPTGDRSPRILTSARCPPFLARWF